MYARYALWWVFVYRTKNNVDCSSKRQLCIQLSVLWWSLLFKTMVFLTVFCYMFVLQTTFISASTNSGREFIVAFLEHIIDNSKFDIYITTSKSTTVNVKISVPLLESSQSPISLSVTKGGRAHAVINKAIGLRGTQKAGKGILITSDGDIIVQCFSTSVSDHYPNSVGGYLALPTHVLGIEYMVTMYREENSNIFAVIGTQDGTVVEISFKLPSGASIKVKSKDYFNGDRITVTVDRYEAVEFLSSKSLVGTKITASKFIAVFVGADFTSVAGSSKDHLIEQLAPLNTWGMDYILIPFPGRSSFDTITVTAQFEDTLVELYGDNHTIVEAGASVILKLSSDAPAYLWSDKRILVIQVSASYDSSTKNSDPSMLAVPPINQWLSEYTFASSMADSKAVDPVLALVTNTRCTSQVAERDGQNSIVFTWTAIAGTSYSFSYSTIPEGFYAVGIMGNDSCSTFGGFLYGPGYHYAWSMSVGQTFNILPDKRDVIDPSSTVLAEAILATTDIKQTSSLAIDPLSSSLEVLVPSSSIEITLQGSSLTTFEPSSSLELLYTSSLLVITNSLSSFDLISPTSTILDMDSYVEVSPTVSIQYSTQPTFSYETLHIDPSSSFGESVINTQIIQYSSSTVTSSIVSRSTLCACKCKPPNVSKEEIHRKLIVNKNNLSSTKRKYYSVVDNRPSSVAIGSAGVVFISITLVLIASSDFFAASGEDNPPKYDALSIYTDNAHIEVEASSSN